MGESGLARTVFSKEPAAVDEDLQGLAAPGGRGFFEQEEVVSVKAKGLGNVVELPTVVTARQVLEADFSKVASCPSDAVLKTWLIDWIAQLKGDLERRIGFVRESIETVLAERGNLWVTAQAERILAEVFEVRSKATYATRADMEAVREDWAGEESRPGGLLNLDQTPFGVEAVRYFRVT